MRFSAFIDSLKCSKHDKNNEKREKQIKDVTMEFVWSSFVESVQKFLKFANFCVFSKQIILLTCFA